MYDLIYDFPTKLMMLGGCSIVSSTIGEAAKMWNLIVVSIISMQIHTYTDGIETSTSKLFI